MDKERKKAIQRAKNRVWDKIIASELELVSLRGRKDADIFGSIKQKSGILGKEVDKKVTMGERKAFLKAQIQIYNQVLTDLDKI